MNDDEAEQPKVNLAKPPARVVVQVHGWYPIVMLVLVFVLISGLNIWYTTHVNNERHKADVKAAETARAASRIQTCQLVVAFDELYKETPPTSPAGIKVAELWAGYRRQLNC